LEAGVGVRHNRDAELSEALKCLRDTVIELEEIAP
jgi:hypothetical protein